MADEEKIPPFERRLKPAQQLSGDLGVIQFQVGSMQTALDRLERTIEKGFDQITHRLEDFDKRLATIERRQEYDAARLKSLEEFRQELDKRNEENRRALERASRAQEAELKAASESAQQARTLKLLGALVSGVFVIAGIVISIIAASGGFS